MDFLINLIVIGAWFGLVIGAVCGIAANELNRTYSGSAEYFSDVARGVTREYLVGRWLVLFFISLIVLIAYYTST